MTFQTLPNPVITFLEKYLPKWLPPQHQEKILDLLSHLPLQTFSSKPLTADTKNYTHQP